MRAEADHRTGSLRSLAASARPWRGANSLKLMSKTGRQKEFTFIRCLRMTAVLLGMVACASFDKANSTTAEVVAVLQRLATENRVCSATIAAVKKRKLDFIQTVSGCQPESKHETGGIYEAASLSKPVFAYAVLKLIDDGKLELDAPVLKYLPEGYRHKFNPFGPDELSETDLISDPRIQQVTVRMVLNHTSGFPNWAGGQLFFRADPGTKWGYSGEAYLMLQRAVEAVTGKRLDRYLSEQLFVRNDLNHSSFVWNSRFEERLVRGTGRDGRSMQPSSPW